MSILVFRWVPCWLLRKMGERGFTRQMMPYGGLFPKDLRLLLLPEALTYTQPKAVEEANFQRRN